MSDGNGGLPAADSRLEQYFLTSPTKLALLIQAAGIEPGDRVVELGAGAGTVARCVPPSAALTLVELDARLAHRLAVATLNEEDFHPRQPRKSRLVRLRRR